MPPKVKDRKRFDVVAADPETMSEGTLTVEEVDDLGEKEELEILTQNEIIYSQRLASFREGCSLGCTGHKGEYHSRTTESMECQHENCNRTSQKEKKRQIE